MKPQNDVGGTFLTAPSPAYPFGGYLVKNRVALGVLFFCDKDCVAGSPRSPGREPLPGLGPAQSEFSDGIVRCSLSLVNHVHFHEEKRGALLSVFSASVWLTHGQWPCRTRALAPQPPGRAPAAAAWSTSAACGHSGAQQGLGVKGGTQDFVLCFQWGCEACIGWGHPRAGTEPESCGSCIPSCWQWGHVQWRAGAGKAVDCLCLRWIYLTRSFFRVTK